MPLPNLCPTYQQLLQQNAPQALLWSGGPFPQPY